MYLNLKKGFAAFALLMTLMAAQAMAQQTVGLFQNDPAATDGYTLLAPNSSTSSYLIDNCGRAVHEWTSGYMPGVSVKLLEDGQLLRTCRIANTAFNGGGLGGRVQLMDWNSNVTWYYEYTNNQHAQHHDAVQMPNGNILFVAWEARTRAEAIAAGRDTSTLLQRLWPDALIEVQPTTPGNGNIVWEWHAWDHLVQEWDNTKANYAVVADHPELINLNYYRPGSLTTNARDWLHVNALSYNPTTDQLAISIHNFDEIWVIDHSTTTVEAASHSGGTAGKGGDLLYRFGNPSTYNRGTVNDHLFWGMHNVNWVPAGDQYAGQMMVFNNGLDRPAGNYSTVEIWQPPLDLLGNYTIAPGQPYGPVATTWKYEDSPNTNFYSMIISGAQRLPGNHTQICEGTTGRVFEIDSAGNTIWEYVNPVQATGPVNQGDSANGNAMFRAYKYLPSYPGLAGQVLTPGAPLEGNPLLLTGACLVSASAAPQQVGIQVMPNPFAGNFELQLSGMDAGWVDVYDLQGRWLAAQYLASPTTQVEATTWASGMYLLRLRDSQIARRVVKY